MIGNIWVWAAAGPWFRGIGRAKTLAEHKADRATVVREALARR
jgi:hypothetical protein